MIVIDATDKIAGRLATYAAKQALLGEQVRIINSEKAVISGSKEKVFDKFISKRQMGTPRGPKYPRFPDRILRRMIRGMLPYKKPRGKAALGRVLCYVGVPEELKETKPTNVKLAEVSKLPNLKYTNLSSISKRLGADFE